MKSKILLASFVSIFLILSLSFISAVIIDKENNGNEGTIWTTRDDCGDIIKDENQYNVEEEVYINGANFDDDEYEWDITGQPGQASCDPGQEIAGSSYNVDDSGSFCFEAYTIANDDCGEYKVHFGKKNDNYHVVPEFGVFVGALTLLGAVGIFFLVRRK